MPLRRPDGFDGWGCLSVGALFVFGAVVAGLVQGVAFALADLDGFRPFGLVVQSVIWAGVSAFLWPLAFALTVLFGAEPWAFPAASCLRGGGAELDFAEWMLPLVAPAGLHGLAMLAAVPISLRNATFDRWSVLVIVSGVPAGLLAAGMVAAYDARERYLIDLGCFP